MAELIRIVDTQGYSYETISVTSATVGLLTVTKYMPTNSPVNNIFARKALLSIEDDSIRYTYDGVTTVTTTVGHLLGSTGVIVLSGIQNIQNIRFVASSATASLRVTYER